MESFDREKEVIGTLRAAGMQVNEFDLTPFKQTAAAIMEKTKATVGPDVVSTALSCAAQ